MRSAIPDRRQPRSAIRAVAARVAAVVTIVVIAILGCCQFGAFAAALDFLNIFVAIWLTLGLIVGMAWTFFGRSKRIPLLALAAVVVLGSVRMLPELAARALPHERPDARGPSLRIVQFNAWKDNSSPATAARWLLRQRADILFLDEVGAGSALWPMLRTRFPYRQTCSVSDRCSTMILSRWRPLAAGGLAQGDPENRMGLSAAWMRLPGRCGAITLVATHMSRPWPWEGAQRDLRALVAAIDRLGRARTIVAGDFNLTPWTAAMRRQDERIALDRATHALPTWPSPLAFGLPLPPVLPLDHIYSGSDLRTTDVVRGPAIGSDHYPVAARVTDLRCDG